MTVVGQDRDLDLSQLVREELAWVRISSVEKGNAVGQIARHGRI